jgi:hypothetical protein
MGDPTQIGRTAFAEECFGYTPLKNAKEKYGLDSRSIWELSSPTTQCYNTILPPRENQPCWICGFPINIKARAGSGINPECEHVLPIAQARLFLDLYASSVVRGEVLTPQQETVFKLEYDWAHSICNQEKSDDSYMIQSRGGYSVNEVSIRKLLTKIYKTDRVGSHILKGYIDSIGFNVWEKRQVKYISDRIQSIINYIQRGEDRDIRGLVMLAGVVDSISTDNLHSQFSELLKDKAVSKEIEYIRKAFNELETSGGLMVGYFSMKLFDILKPSLARNKNTYSIIFETSDVNQQSILKWSMRHLSQYIPIYKSTYDQMFAVNPSIAEPVAIKTLIIVFLYVFLLTLSRYEASGTSVDRKIRPVIENLISIEETIFLQNQSVPDEFKASFRMYILSHFSDAKQK